MDYNFDFTKMDSLLQTQHMEPQKRKGISFQHILAIELESNGSKLREYFAKVIGKKIGETVSFNEDFEVGLGSYDDEISVDGQSCK